MLAEIALQGIDTLFESRTGICYNRYVDDILILGPAGVARSTAYELIAELKALKLIPHDFEPGPKSKVESLTDPFSFLGYQIDGGQVLIRHESILRFESSIAKIFTVYRHKLATARRPADKESALAYCQWKLNLRITGCIRLWLGSGDLLQALSWVELLPIDWTEALSSTFFDNLHNHKT